MLYLSTKWVTIQAKNGTGSKRITGTVTGGRERKQP